MVVLLALLPTTIPQSMITFNSTKYVVYLKVQLLITTEINNTLVLSWEIGGRV